MGCAWLAAGRRRPPRPHSPAPNLDPGSPAMFSTPPKVLEFWPWLPNSVPSRMATTTVTTLQAQGGGGRPGAREGGSGVDQTFIHPLQHPAPPAASLASYRSSSLPHPRAYAVVVDVAQQLLEVAARQHRGLHRGAAHVQVGGGQRRVARGRRAAAGVWVGGGWVWSWGARAGPSYGAALNTRVRPAELPPVKLPPPTHPHPPTHPPLSTRPHTKQGPTHLCLSTMALTAAASSLPR